jgi:hypothetical protein
MKLYELYKHTQLKDGVLFVRKKADETQITKIVTMFVILVASEAITKCNICSYIQSAFSAEV